MDDRTEAVGEGGEDQKHDNQQETARHERVGEEKETSAEVRGGERNEEEEAETEVCSL